MSRTDLLSGAGSTPKSVGWRQGPGQIPRRGDLWGLTPPARQEPGEDGESGQPEMEESVPDVAEEEAVEPTDGSVDSPPSPILLSPRTRKVLKQRLPCKRNLRLQARNPSEQGM